VALSVKFTRILKMVQFNQLDISTELIPTYCCLADYANKKGYCYPSMETLASTLNCSVRTIQRHIKELVEKGLIEIVQRRRIKGKLSTYLYKIVHIAHMYSTGHRRQVDRSRRKPRKSKKNRQNRKDRTKQDFNTPFIPPLKLDNKRDKERRKKERMATITSLNISLTPNYSESGRSGQPRMIRSPTSRLIEKQSILK
jgi:DNA-binding transcriptional MocR family regulator